MIKALYSLLTCILLTSFAWGQHYSFVSYSVKEGLAQTQVYSICQDEEGYLWLGTAGGASKFDGATFTNYSTENGLLHNVVISVNSFKGFVWVFTQNGVTRIKGNEVITFDFSEVVKGNPIALAKFIKSENSIWIAVKNDGILRVPLGSNDKPLLEEVHNIPSPVPAGIPIRSFFEDANQKVWMGAKGYIGYYSNQKWHATPIPQSAMNTSDIKQDQSGDFWISVYREGVYRFDGQSYQLYNEGDGVASILNRFVFVDSKNRIWLGSKLGVSVIEKGEIRTFNESNGLPNEAVETLFEDHEGNIWIGSDGSGVFRFTSDEFVSYTTSSGLGSDYIMSIVQDSTYNYWFSTYGNGITRFDGKQYTYFTTENGELPNNIIWTSIKDHQGKLWFGSSDGLICTGKEKIITYKDLPWLPANKITSLFEDKEENLYVGTSRGLSVKYADTWKKYDDSIGANLKNVRAIEKGKGNQIWLGTSNGIFVFNKTYCEPWINNDQLKDKVVYCIENYKDSLWFIGTGNGAYYTDGVNCIKMNLGESFSANFVNFITIETNRYLWIGTNYGIFEIDLWNYFGAIDQAAIHHTHNNGIIGVETNLNASFEDAQGDIWMGTGSGLMRFDRKKRIASQKTIIPRTYIDEIQLFLKPTDWKKYVDEVDPYTRLPHSLSLAHNKNYLTFNFGSISLSDAKNIKYKLKLEGLDQAWTPILNQTSFTYPNLSHGTYVFKVKSSTDGVNWSTPATFSFEIRKPYYLTWWFFLLSFFTLLLLLSILIRWRQNIAKGKRETEKLGFKTKLLTLEQQALNASMNRHFIFNALNSIQYYINTQDRLSANQYLTNFAKLIRKNLDSAIADNGMVTLSDEIERLDLYVSLEHMRFQKKFEYKLDLENGIDPEMIKLPAMILQPFVENSIWHGILPKEEKGTIQVRIYRQKESIVFEIEDNGIGYDTSQANKSDDAHDSKGMMITANRIELLKKVNQQKMLIEGPRQVNDKSGNPAGTKVTITLEIIDNVTLSE